MTTVGTKPMQIPQTTVVENAPNGSISSRPSRQTTLKSSGSQESRNGRLRLQIPPHIKRTSTGSFNGKKTFDKFRRLSMAAGIPRMGRIAQLDYKTIGRRFARQSTINGISHAALADNAKWRYFWIVVFILCLCALIFHVMFLVIKYFAAPKTVNLDLKFENAPFPAVTLCNLNPYKASAIANDDETRATMEAFQRIVNSGQQNYGIATALSSRLKSGSRNKRQLSNESKQRRYHQVYAQCYCEINRLSGERKKGSCFAAYKGKISLSFVDNNLHNFHPSKCLCQLDTVSKSLWPCFPYNTWKEKMCTECRAQLGHCPMRFYNGSQNSPKIHNEMDICLCHNEYNHCIANNENGHIPEIIPSDDIESNEIMHKFNFTKSESIRSTTTTTTEAPEIRQAMGFEELKDEIAIHTQAKQNLMFTVGEKPLRQRVGLSQSKDELILKCSFNQRDCDIKNDFKLHYDNTYGNCYTFNWNRTKAVTAHRAGANYGLRVLLYANVSEYLPTSESVGFRITVHDKWAMPFPDAFGYSAPTGFMSSFGVRMKQFNRISPPYGRCMDGGEDDKNYIYKGFNYSVEGCHRSCTQKEVIRVCGCADPMYPVVGKIKTCSVNDPTARECVKNTTQHLGRLIAEDNVPNCNCHQPCKEVAYAVSFSSARWPSGTSKIMECEVTDDLCMEKYRKNAAMIQVFYEELNYETMSESPAYGLGNLLADLGGATGLWIGFSVVSLMEIVVLFSYCGNAFYLKRKGSIQTAQMFNINQEPMKKRSASSSTASRPFYRKTPSSKSNSKHSIVDEYDNKTKSSLPAVSEKDNLSIPSEQDDEDLENPSGKSSPYLPPGAELPCVCLYDQVGRIVKMKALCPEHGYMVRRGTGFSCDDEDDEEYGQEVEGDWEED